MVELIWDGKYDAQGRRTAPLRLKLPFQTVETVNESAQERQRTLDLFGAGRPTEWRNRLIWGDKKYVLPALLDEFAGQVDLIYIDPPFATGADFSYQVTIEDEEFIKEPSVIEQKAYRDTWGHRPDSYTGWFCDTAILLRELMAPTGTIYVHCDWRLSGILRITLDEVFGPDRFLNHLVWVYGESARGGKAISSQFPRNHDDILFYSRGERWTFNGDTVTRAYTEEEARDIGYRQQEDGRWFKTAPRGNYTDQSVRRLDEEGRIHRTRSGGIRIKYFLTAENGRVVEQVPVGDAWLDIPDAMHIPKAEQTGYATQKPEALLERIIKASSNEGDLVLDCFCGSGTTAAVAEKLNRHWIACDLGRFAIHTTRKRLLSTEGVRPFVVQNLGKYERQAWQAAEFGGPERAQETMARYRRFILELYHARPIQGYAWLHGVKEGRMVHVGAVDAPVSPGDVTQIAMEFRKAVGSGKDAPALSAVDVLGWDFAFELNEVARQQAEQANIQMRFLRIPREVLEKRAVEQGDIAFYELAALSVDVKQKGRKVELALTDFVIPPDDVPADVQAAISHWAQWVDYWAVDWDNRGDTFHNMWQTYRTRKDKTLRLQTSHTYEAPGEYRIMVKVIDILGNDTTKTLKVIVL